MKTLEHNQLLEYLRHAIKLESALVTQNRIIEQYNRISENKAPTLNLYEEPEVPRRKNAEYTPSGTELFLGYGLGGFFALLAFIFFCGLIEGSSAVGGLICLLFAIPFSFVDANRAIYNHAHFLLVPFFHTFTSHRNGGRFNVRHSAFLSSSNSFRPRKFAGTTISIGFRVVE